MNDPLLNVLILPGGQLPVRGRLHDGGCDAFIRAIVTPDYDSVVRGMKRTIWDFKSPPHSSLRKHSRLENGKWKYNLPPGGIITVGLGVMFGGKSVGWCVQTCRRSKAALMRLRLHDYLEEVIIDPNFRGEPMSIIKNDGDTPLEISHGSSYTQFLFTCEGALARPVLNVVKTYEELGETDRGQKWAGSSDSPVRQASFDFEEEVRYRMPA